MEVKQVMPELHWFISDVGDCFAELDNHFQILEEHFLNFCAIHNAPFTDTTGF